MIHVLNTVLIGFLVESLDQALYTLLIAVKTVKCYRVGIRGRISSSVIKILFTGGDL